MTYLQPTVVYEKEMDLDFIDEVFALPGGEKIKRCIQCGTCSGSCPVSWAMEETPRQLLAMIRAGMRDRVLSSSTIWTCASCYTCAVRCPQEIAITDLMYLLKRLAIRARHPGSQPGEVLARSFARLVRRTGRNHEPRLMTRFLLSTRPHRMLAAAPIGWKLAVRGRMPLRGTAIRGIEGFRRIMTKAEKIAASRETGTWEEREAVPTVPAAQMVGGPR